MARRGWIWQVVSVREKRPDGGLLLWLFPTAAARPYWMKQSGLWWCIWAEFGNSRSVFAPAVLGYVQSTWPTRYAGRLVTVVEALLPEQVPRPQKGDFVRPTVEMGKLVPRVRSLAMARLSVESYLNTLEPESPERQRLESRLGQLEQRFECSREMLRDRREAWGNRPYPYANEDAIPKSQLPTWKQKLFGA